MNTTVKAHGRTKKGSGKRSMVKAHARVTKGSKTIPGSNPMKEGSVAKGSNMSSVKTGKTISGKNTMKMGSQVKGSTNQASMNRAGSKSISGKNTMPQSKRLYDCKK